MSFGRSQAVFNLQSLQLLSLLGLAYVVAGQRLTAATLALGFLAFNYEEVGQDRFVLKFSRTILTPCSCWLNFTR